MAITFEKVLTLKNVSMFQDASEMALSDLIGTADELTFKAGEVICPAKKENQYLFIILSGTVHCVQGVDVLTELGPRQFFGETTVFHPVVLPYGFVAHDKTTVLRIHVHRLYQMMTLHPSIARGFIGELSKRLLVEQVKKNQNNI